ncbi:MAG: terminase [Bacteroidales bacterium]|nr:terminase [Bacteroidales bacterium]
MEETKDWEMAALVTDTKNKTDAAEVEKILAENDQRNAVVYAKFNPISGLCSIGERFRVEIEDFPIRVQYLPVEMKKIPLVKKLIKHGSLKAFLYDELGTTEEDYEDDRQKVIQQFVKLRCRYDFAFWAATYVYIKIKGGGEDILFRLSRPQRKFVTRLEEFRKADKPIRLVLLKARQWGGSTTSQLYMAWLQLMHKVGLNSLIIAHQGTATDEIKDMFDRMISRYPVEMLHRLGEKYDENEPKMVGVGKSGSIHRVPQRNCKIKIGTVERPDSCRGGDYNLVHLSEVGLWKVTDGKKPEDIVRSACSGVLLKPYTMIIYESTANGTGNFFHREYVDASKNEGSQFQSLFVSWFEIEWNSLPIDNLETFAANLYANRENDNVSSNRKDSGRYLWWLWEKGATLEAINWYIQERTKYTDHGLFAAECPTDDIEAFVNTGQNVFDRYRVDALKDSCHDPRCIGEVYADRDEGKEALKNVRFANDRQGLLWIWEFPEIDKDEKVTDRYLVVVDVGGRSSKADWSVIVVFDRLFMIDGDKPVVVAQWYGHTDIDLLAWKAAQIAKFYDNALLVIESNTLETHDRERQVEGDQSHFILNQIKDVYPNLYARKQSEEDIRQGLPRKYGFHTNVSTKPMIISSLVKTVRENLYIERDKRCLDEYYVYERKQNGAYGAITGYHDDLLMTRAIGLHICFYEMDMPRIVPRIGHLTAKRKTVSAATI